MESPENPKSPRVGLIYDERMCRHTTPDGEQHPESPQRIRAIWRKLEAEGIPQRCIVLDAKQADDKYLAAVHTKSHINLIRKISSKEFDSRRLKIASKLNSIYFNNGSSEAAYLSAGSVIEASVRVGMGDLNSAVAIVRPPGHHAEPDEAMGFCLFNNVAVAANVLLNERPELGIKKLLIVDWDVHHGNGTQKVFYDDPRVLFFSVHRFDSGTFYPAGGDGSLCMIGEDEGAGYNINVPWEHGKCGDVDYIAVWDHVLIPVAEAYNPDIILISAGFDAAMGDPLGGCCITPFGYSLMLKKLMRFAGGKIVMALEGGYNLTSISNSMLACVKTLLEETTVDGSLVGSPFESTWRVIQEVRHELKTFWPSLSAELPQDILISNKQPLPVGWSWISSSDSDGDYEEISFSSIGTINHVETVEDIILPLAMLDVGDSGGELEKAVTPNVITNDQISMAFTETSQRTPTSLLEQVDRFCAPWRSDLSKVEVWYASFGSNMWKDRFLCYIAGGMVDGMNKPCHGSRDKSLPRDVIWKIVPHKIFFAQSYTRTWGNGGVAFLHPESSASDRAYMCIYRITLEQFNDVLYQENRASPLQMELPLLDATQLELLAENKTMLLDVFKDGWYSNVLYLGKEDNLPILTMTCPFSYIEQFKSGELPMCAPAENYVNTLVRGLVEGEQLTREQAMQYIEEATSRKL